MSRKPCYANIIYIIVLLLSILFLYTATSKLLHLDIFQLRLQRMPYIAPLATGLVWYVPFMELLIAGLLLIPKYRILGLYASLVLLALFTGYIGTVLQFSDSIPCSCGGALSALGWKDHLVFNGACMAMALWAIILNKKLHQKTFLDQNTT
ncbi:MauE/DoxX family redox-associated membrane protein [Allomuricauda sp. F6463D]|uniref:MauE/DoxX family redox-associated membrane protein n=1 Tax=Allomuricauda sp. F6463D TaxID=2926409 RepID=UPI001FF513E4|nr:MauE/DoxX family redox-associated membrane protein [Muricauda sp. F6463D]MCK0159049.1 hypothetical protein [Muricauda sp. F6463D]